MIGVTLTPLGEAMNDPDPAVRVCKLHTTEFGTLELRPGQSLRCGRHRDNDLVLPDTMVSRFHARFTWDPGLEQPVVFDNASQNGTTVDGRRVRNATPLRDGSCVRIGPFQIRVELVGPPPGPAVLQDTGDMVTLFSEDGPDLEGILPTTDALREFMLQLERERRTGTLRMKLDTPRGETTRAVVTFCLGRIMAAEVRDGKGLRALERILCAKSGRYLFTRELEPREDPMNLWVSDYLRSRNLEPGEQTQRFKPTQRSRRPF